MFKLSMTGASIAASTTAYASGVTAAAGTPFTLAANAPSDGLGHTIIITPSGSITGNFTISGLDVNGNTISEILATNTTNAVTSLKYYASAIVVLAPAGMGAQTVSIGPTAVSVSAMVLPQKELRRTNGQFNIGFGCIVAAGSPTFSVQVTYDAQNWFEHAVVTGKTASTQGSITSPVLAMQLAWTAAGTVNFTGWQVGD